MKILNRKGKPNNFPVDPEFQGIFAVVILTKFYDARS